jgi:SAM-dependent methyltransferase
MQDLSIYTRAYYERDQTFAKYNVLRSDQLAALCYTLDWPFWADFRDLPTRDPGLIVSIGAGRGELEAEFERLGYTVIGVDPSNGPHELYKAATLQRNWTPELIKQAHTIVYCESLEHIPRDEALAVIREHSVPGTRIVIVNFVDYFPLAPSGDGDHITMVDDAYLDHLSAGQSVLFRKGSHLVFDRV